MAAQEGERKKQSGTWLFVSHDAADADALVSAVRSQLHAHGLVWFKFEPFVLHVCCKDVDTARQLV